MQLLNIAPTPDEAYELCNKYAKDCEEDNLQIRHFSNLEQTTRSFTSFADNRSKGKIATLQVYIFNVRRISTEHNLVVRNNTTCDDEECSTNAYDFSTAESSEG